MNSAAVSKNRVFSEPAALVCFHCGNPVPAALNLWVMHQGKQQPMCCHGCQAVAQAIVAGGFETYYQQRSEFVSAAALPRTRDELLAYDEPIFLAQQTRGLPNGDQELVLLLDGLRCAACVWLNEQAVRRLPGVTAFHINRMTERATLQFKPGVTPLSQVLSAIESIGYRAWPFNRERAQQLEKNQQQQLLRQWFVAGVAMMQVMMFAAPWYFAAPGDVEPAWEIVLRWASLLLTIPVMLYSAAPIFSGAWRDLSNRGIGMDVPVALALAAAFAASVWATLTQQGAVYFDSITMFVFLLLSARYLEGWLRRRAWQGLSHALRAVPQQMTRLQQEGEETVSVHAVAVGDRVRLKPGETLALDVRLLSASAELDLSLLTGETLPVLKKTGDTLPAGALNLSAGIEAQVLHGHADSFISSLERLIERAGRDRPRLQQVADRVAAWFLSALLVLTAAVALAWWFVDPTRALPIAIAVLVVSCPCALSLATPAALAAASATLARRGLLITRANTLEKMARLTDLAFDKTGTLTEARPRLRSVQVCAPSFDSETVLAMAAALEQHTQHPYAQAFLHAAEKQFLTLPVVSQSEVHIGAGVQGVIHGSCYRLGKREFLQAALGLSAPSATEPLPALPQAQVWLANASEIVATFTFELPLRPGTARAVQALHTQGLTLHVLSGDNHAAAQAIGQTLQIADAQGDLLPEQKLQQVRAWQSQGRVVAMLGDGINDAPVLAGADVSIALGDGTELAQISADAVLMTPHFEVLVHALKVARQTLAVMRQNLAWAALYNALAIPAAALGYVSPLVAAIGMSLSSLLVVLNAMRLQWLK